MIGEDIYVVVRSILKGDLVGDLLTCDNLPHSRIQAKGKNPPEVYLIDKMHAGAFYAVIEEVVPLRGMLDRRIP